jgi:hypothetical protein
MAGLIRNLTEIDWVRAPRFGVAALPDQRVAGEGMLLIEGEERPLERIPYGGWLE